MAEKAQSALGGGWRALGRGLLGLAAALALQTAFAQRTAADPRWDSLPPAQQQILTPLAGEWDRLDPASRKRWLGVAQRYPTMTPIGQKRVQTRMKKWAALTPQQREEARTKYKNMKRKSGSTALKSEWQRYQALPAKEREALAAGERKPTAAAKRKRQGSVPAAEAFSQ
jgi:hypothetical protein